MIERKNKIYLLILIILSLTSIEVRPAEAIATFEPSHSGKLLSEVPQAKKVIKHFNLSEWNNPLTTLSGGIGFKKTQVKNPIENTTSAASKNLVLLPSLSKWSKLSSDNKASLIVSFIYQQNQNKQLVSVEQIQLLLGKPIQEIILKDGKEQHLFQVADQTYPIEIKLVFDTHTDSYIEALAEHELELQENFLTFNQFERLGTKLIENYANRQNTDLKVAEDLFGSPDSISYIFDVKVYRYFDEAKNAYSVTVKEYKVTNLNFTSADSAEVMKPIKQTKKQLDRLSHEAGLNINEIKDILGNPMSINYDSNIGVIAIAWFSKHEHSVKEVYYYYAYNGISIGLSYH